MSNRPVIVSYNSQDRTQAQAVVEELESFGASVWWDQDGIVAGDNWRNKFAEAIEGDSREVIALVILGKNGIGKAQRQEIEFLLSRQSQVRITPVLVDEGVRKIFDGIIGLSGVTVADLRTDAPKREQERNKLLQQILTENYGSLIRHLAILHPVELKPRSCYLSMSNQLARGEWEDFRRGLTEIDFNLLEDLDSKPDAFTLLTRKTIRSASVVVVDGRLVENGQNIAADAAYALGLGRAYYKPIVLVVDRGNTSIDPSSIFCLLECDEGIEEISDQIVAAVENAFQHLCSPFLSTGDSEVLALRFSDLHVCPRLRADVFRLTEAYSRHWGELERVSQGLNFLLGIAKIAVGEEAQFESSEASKRIANIFFDDFNQRILEDFQGIGVLDDASPVMQSDAARVMQRIQERAGTNQPDVAKNATRFLELFFERIARLKRCHDESIAESESSRRGAEIWYKGPQWWIKQVDVQLRYIKEAREYLDQFFTGLMRLLKPQHPETENYDNSNSRTESNASIDAKRET